MPNNNYKNWESFISRTKIYLIIIALLMLVICIYDYRLIIPGILIYGIIIFYTIWSNKKRKAELSEQLKDLTLNVNTTAKTTLINSPFPLAIVETDGNLIWKSEKFVTEFEIPEVEINEYITEIVKETIADQSMKTLNQNAVKEQALAKIQDLYGSKCIVRLALDGFMFQ